MWNRSSRIACHAPNVKISANFLLSPGLFIHPWFWNNLSVKNPCLFFLYNNNNNKIPIFILSQKYFFIIRYFGKNFIDGTVHWKIILSLSLWSLYFTKPIKYFRKPLLDETKGREWSNNSIQKGEGWDLTGKLETWSIPFQSNWRS